MSTAAVETKVFKLGAGCRLVPVSFEGAEIGNRVRWAGDEALYTIIAREATGWTIANGKGEIHSGQQTESLSPYTRITVETNLPTASAEEIEAIKEAVEDKKREDAAQYQVERSQHQTDYERFLSEIRRQYPNAAQTGSSYARAAKNLKAELKKAFPLVAFSVKSESYSGGSSVRVEWTDGCTTAQVKEIADKYQHGNFNSDEEIYDYDPSAYAKAVQEHLGSAKYVSTTRTISDEVKAQVRAELQRSHIHELESYELDTQVYRALEGAEIYGAFTGIEIERGSSVARFAPAANQMPAASASAGSETATTTTEEFTTGEFTHTTKNTTCFAASLVSRVEKSRFAEILQIAKSCGGYYSSFRRDGAIAGFIFPTAEKREAFLSRFK